MGRKAAGTGPGPTAIVALEQRMPESERILTDSLAFDILPFGSRLVTRIKSTLFSMRYMINWMEKTVPGMWSGFLCRKRFIDDAVVQAVESGGAEAIVNLGCGSDTRLYRLPELSAIPAWEVDQPANIDAKRSRLTQVLGALPPYVTLVPIDFDHEDLATVLRTNGYDGNRRTFFIWEAVTQYVTEDGVRGVFDYLSHAPTGSRLAFTYVRRDFIDGTERYGHDYLYNQMIAKNRALHFGLNPDEVADFIAPYGWSVVEHLGYDELAERYVPPGRTLLSTPLERMVLAEKG